MLRFPNPSFWCISQVLALTHMSVWTEYFYSSAQWTQNLCLGRCCFSYRGKKIAPGVPSFITKTNTRKWTDNISMYVIKLFYFFLIGSTHSTLLGSVPSLPMHVWLHPRSTRNPHTLAFTPRPPRAFSLWNQPRCSKFLNSSTSNANESSAFL